MYFISFKRYRTHKRDFSFKKYHLLAPPPLQSPTPRQHHGPTKPNFGCERPKEVSVGKSQ